MAKQTIKVGGREIELDLLTKEELRTTAEQLLSGYLRPTTPRRDEDGIVVSGSPAPVTITLPPTPRGMEVVYTRVVIDAPGSAFTPGAPFQVANGYVGLYRDQELLDFQAIPVVANGPGIPFRWTWSTSYGLRFRDGEALSAIVGVSPANGTQLVLRADGFLSPIEGTEGKLLLPA